MENVVESKSWKLNRKIFEINQDVSEVKLHRCRQKFPFQSFVSKQPFFVSPLLKTFTISISDSVASSFSLFNELQNKFNCSKIENRSRLTKRKLSLQPGRKTEKTTSAWRLKPYKALLSLRNHSQQWAN